MTTRAPTAGGRRRPLPLPVLLGTAVLVAVCAGGVYAAARSAEPGPGSGHERTAVTAGRAPALLARRAEAVPARELTRSLAAARRGSGSPIAVVRRPTRLRSSPGGRAVERLGRSTEFGSPRVQAVVGREGEWLEVMAAELPNGRTGWLPAAAVEVQGTRYAVRASLGERVLTVRRRGRPVRRVPVGVGAPATPTPTGRYAVTDKLRMSGDGSPYGCCALALTGHQPRVPEGWPGGDRLAVHGTAHEATVGHAASFGCLRARGADMRWLLDRVPLGTPVAITP